MWFEIFLAIIFTAGFIYSLLPKTPATSICVLVMGDLGRSPRMQYHALSLARTYKCNVDLVGLPGAALHPDVIAQQNITVHYFKDFEIPEFLATFQGTPLYRPLFLLAKIVHQFTEIITTLNSVIERPQCILLQTPPALPIIFCACMMGIFVLRAPVVIDWHNFGYTLMAMNPATRKIPLALQVAEICEWWSGKMASAHLCVTDAMRKWLQKNWDISPAAFHDQPPAIFKTYNAMSIADKHALWSKLQAQNDLAGISDVPIIKMKQQSTNSSNTNTTAQTTELNTTQTTQTQTYNHQLPPSKWLAMHTTINNNDNNNNNITNDSLIIGSTPTLLTTSSTEYNANRPFLCVSSTSWTEDEDFGVLLNALLQLDQDLTTFNTTYNTTQTVLCIITGKGDQRAAYQLIIDYLHQTSNGLLLSIQNQNMFNNKLLTKDQTLFDLTLEQFMGLDAAGKAAISTALNGAGFDHFIHIWKKVLIFFQDQQKKQKNNSTENENEKKIFVSKPLHELKYVRLSTVWLEPGDYPALLACCDVGISLHNSSSGLDLPMKVVDMFGAALPSIAVNFPCLYELVKDRENGLVFDRGQYQQLSALLFSLIPCVQQRAPQVALACQGIQRRSIALYQPNYDLTTLPQGLITIEKMRDNLEQTRHTRVWDTNWTRVVKPIVDKYIKSEYHYETGGN